MKKLTTNLEAIEAFARGAMSALLAGSEGAVIATRPRRRSSRRANSDVASASPRQPRWKNYEAEVNVKQMPLIEEPISAPGVPDEMPAAPLTQAQLEAMERVLRGEVPNGYYKPDEGVAPWMES